MDRIEKLIEEGNPLWCVVKDISCSLSAMFKICNKYETTGLLLCLVLMAYQASRVT